MRIRDAVWGSHFGCDVTVSVEEARSCDGRYVLREVARERGDNLQLVDFSVQSGAKPMEMDLVLHFQPPNGRDVRLDTSGDRPRRYQGEELARLNRETLLEYLRIHDRARAGVEEMMAKRGLKLPLDDGAYATSHEWGKDGATKKLEPGTYLESRFVPYETPSITRYDGGSCIVCYTRPNANLDSRRCCASDCDCACHR